MNNVIFYDGECGLCQRSLAFLIKLDRHKILLFAPLNGQSYKQLFDKESDLSTVVFYKNSRLYEKSDAIIEAMITSGGWLKIAVLLKIFPKFFRDKFYDFIASHRRKVSCIILPVDHRFLN